MSDEGLDKPMDASNISENVMGHNIPPPAIIRSRRWSLDVLSPKKFLSSKRGSDSMIALSTGYDLELSSTTLQRYERSHSKTDFKDIHLMVPQSFYRFLHHHHLLRRHLCETEESFIVLELDTGEKTVMTFRNGQQVRDLQTAIMKLGVRSYRSIVGSPMAAMFQRVKSCGNLLGLVKDEVQDKERESDIRLNLVCSMVLEEKVYCGKLEAFIVIFTEQLRKFSSFYQTQHDALLVSVDSLLSASISLVQKIQASLDTWSSRTSEIGNLFTTSLWTDYQRYCKAYVAFKRVLDKQQEYPFGDWSESEHDQGRLLFQELLGLPVKRIKDYEKFLNGLLEATDKSHVDYVDIYSSLRRLRSMIKKSDEESIPEDKTLMEDVDLRPSQDQLSLSTDRATNGSSDSINIANHIDSSITIINNNNSSENDKQAAKNRKQSGRRKSAPSAVLLKPLTSPKSKGSPSVWHSSGNDRKDQDDISLHKLPDGDPNRLFIMEGHVQFARGGQVQDRYLFLFSDFFLVTKPKSSTTFRLKHRVQLCDMWIASCVDDVAEIRRPPDRSFVLGWPTTNVVATFPTIDMKDDWLRKLSENITKEKLKDEHKSLQLTVALRDIDPNACHTCQTTINNFTQAKQVLVDCLKQRNMSESEAKNHQLWVVTGKDGSPYPLIGHETPFSIKLSQARSLSRSRSDNDLDTMSATDLDTINECGPQTGQKCEFYLKQKASPKKNNFDTPHHKPMKKNKKSPKFFKTIFRKKRTAEHLVFGLPLSEICDENLDPPESIIKLMVLVYKQGPHTSGILRRGNNAALGREIKEKIDSGDKYTLEEHMAPTAASVFKELLRGIPDGLLMSSLHDQWLTIRKDEPHGEKINKTKVILAKLSPANYHMIKLTICLLQHLAKHSSENHMGPTNLATCIAPSLYEHHAGGFPDGKLKGDTQKQMEESVSEIQNIIVPLISFMITNHVELFGEDILEMFVKYGCQASPPLSLEEERYDSQMQPSGEEEEDEDMVEEEGDNDSFSGKLSKKQHGQVQQRGQHMLRECNSGTDSDSMHSVLSIQDAGMGLQRDDSSIDSLGDRDYYAHESPKAMKSHLSPSNLSRDSGLTLSDNQLFDEEAYQADIASTAAKMFQSSSQFADQDDAYEHGCDRHSTDSQFDRSSNPVAPPRRRSVRSKPAHIGTSDGRWHGYVEYAQRSPLKHNASAAFLDDSGGNHTEQRSMLAHSSLDKRVSSQSIGEDVEVVESLPRTMDFHKISARTDIGTLSKSESGAHLFLGEETLPARTSSEHEIEPNILRHSSSVIGSSVTVSPESRHSQSSCDSVISDSTYSISRDGSVNSAPLTPDEPQNDFLNWVPDINLPPKPWQRLLTSGNSQQSHACSKSTSDLLSRHDDRNNGNLLSENSPKLNLITKSWPGKSHEAEEVQIYGRPRVDSKNHPGSISYSTDASPPQTIIQYGKQRFPTYQDSGSPPPNILLRHLAARSGRDYCYDTAKRRRSSVDSLEPRHSDFSREMQSIKLEEYMNVKSKPIIISSESASLNLASSATSRLKLSKYISPQMDLSLKDSNFVLPQRSSRQLGYQQAIQRNTMLKYNMPVDVTETQREKCAKAKEMYEKSLQLFSEQSGAKSCDFQSSTLVKPTSNLVPSSNLAYAGESKFGSEIDDSMMSGRTSHLDINHSGYSSHGRFQSAAAISGNPDHSGASGFLDMGSVSHSIQEDIFSRRQTHAESITNYVGRGLSLVNLSRNGSKLSDTGSCGSNSSVAVSTLSRNSGSFSCGSDLSNTSSVTVSSVTSSDSNSEIGFAMSKYGSANRFDQPCHPILPSNRFSTAEDETIKDDDEADNYINTLTKDPEELYLQSRQIYEQKSSSDPPRDKTSVILPSYSRHPHHLPGNLPESHSRATSQVNSPRGRSTEPKARLNLEIPSINLHRSRSDSAEHAHRLDSYGSRSTKTRHGTESGKEIQRPSNEESLPLDIKTELHQNFMKAKSCFHQPEVAGRRYSTSSSPYPVLQSPFSQDSQSGKWPQTTPSAKVTSSETALPPAVKPQVPSPHAELSTSQAHKEFHWSVKDLKSIYDKDRPITDPGGNESSTSGNGKSTSQTSPPSRPHSPPPYQNPPPFRHHPTSTDQAFSANKTFTSRRQGPQCFKYDPTHGTCSSSEESCGSSPDRRSTWLSDNEELSDYTNTTYI